MISRKATRIVNILFGAGIVLLGYPFLEGPLVKIRGHLFDFGEYHYIIGLSVVTFGLCVMLHAYIFDPKDCILSCRKCDKTYKRKDVANSLCPQCRNPMNIIYLGEPK